ncbi:MAG: hypothetical protein HQ575_05410 [Candidatus Omnitrophica bacterium]|nr:hypothetical protein [Candidatus Omnitrophota bacterium]
MKYEIDPYNRLVIHKGGRSGVPKHRLSLDGRFKTANDNTLQYLIKTPPNSGKANDLPHRISLNGKYSLTKDHDLKITLRHSYKQRSKEVFLIKGDILFVKKNTIGFGVSTRNSDGTMLTRTLNLNGRWALDKRQRILFKVERRGGKDDTLTFTGNWEINKDNEVEYSYTKKGANRNSRLIFKGCWKIIDKNRLNYALDLKGRSGFIFQARLARAGLFGKKNALVYTFGTKLGGERSRIKTITLFGKWQLTRRTGLLFEIRYSDGRKNFISFGAEVKLSKDNDLQLILRDKNGKPLGIEIRFKKRFLKGTGEALLKLLADNEEKSIILSVGKLF